MKKKCLFENEVRNGVCGESTVFNHRATKIKPHALPEKLLPVRIVHQELTVLRLQDQAMLAW